MIFETRRVDVPIVLVGQLCDHTNTEMNATEAMKEEAGLWDECNLQAKVTRASFLNFFNIPPVPCKDHRERLNEQ